LVSRIVVVTERRHSAHISGGLAFGKHREKILTVVGAPSTIPAIDRRNQS
jgi:hypothetical protein